MDNKQPLPLSDRNKEDIERGLQDAKEGKLVPAPKDVEPEKKASERLEESLRKRLDIDSWFRTKLVASMSAADWSWLVKLAEWGLEARHKEVADRPRSERDISDVLSLSDFQRSIDDLVSSLEKAPLIKPKQRKTKNPR